MIKKLFACSVLTAGLFSNVPATASATLTIEQGVLAGTRTNGIDAYPCAAPPIGPNRCVRLRESSICLCCDALHEGGGRNTF